MHPSEGLGNKHVKTMSILAEDRYSFHLGPWS